MICAITGILTSFIKNKWKATSRVHYSQIKVCMRCRYIVCYSPRCHCMRANHVPLLPSPIFIIIAVVIRFASYKKYKTRTRTTTTEETSLLCLQLRCLVIGAPKVKNYGLATIPAEHYTPSITRHVVL